MTPRFAVVGHPNKGKSSIVSTLAEDANVAISDLPGTTRESTVFPMRVDDQILYELIDTPGFQRPREVLAWLDTHSSGPQDRADAVARFIDTHKDDPRFHDECELLRPIVDGAGILYVVDGSHPYGNEYEPEMQILRWTGRPRMALVNLIGDGDHIDEWRRALDQYFSVVRVFDALHADTTTRFGLLQLFGELEEKWLTDINRAIEILKTEYRRRQHVAAQAIANLVIHALSHTRSQRMGESEDPDHVVRKLEHELQDEITSLEQRVRGEIEALYHHHELERHGTSLASIELDLFSGESEELFGLSRAQLAASAAMSGAIAGGSIDILLGGASLLAGAGLGALIGGASALFGTDRLAKVKILGQSMATRRVTVGPFRNPNLPWVLLGRALLHHRLVATRNHARREALIIDAERTRHAADALSEDVRARLSRLFGKIQQSGHDPSDNSLQELIETLLVGDIDQPT